MDDSTSQPLVSVPVITYKSSKTVVETLDSIYNQTYPNMELIVSDDCSTDNTVEICRKWIEAHKERFARTELLVVEKNTGVSANMNRAEEACRGEWVKPIAGDDILLPDCIETYMDFVLEYPEAVYVFSRIKRFTEIDGVKQYKDYPLDYVFFQWETKRQIDFLLKEYNCIPAPTSFYNRHVIKKKNLKNDETIPLIDDWPRWIECLKKGIHFDFIDRCVVLYRCSGFSVSQSSVFCVKYRKSLSLFYLKYQFYQIFLQLDLDFLIFHIF